MISPTKNSFSRFALAASLGAVCASGASFAHAGVGYQITVGEGTFGPAGSVPYNNGIIQDYATNLDGPLDVPQYAGFRYSDAAHEVNGIDGNYKVTAEASNAHGGTAHAYAFGDGGFSGYSSSVDAFPYPQEGYTEASATVGYGFRLVGPASASPVPVTFNAKAYVTTAGTGLGSADLLIYSDSLAPLVDWELGGGGVDQTNPGGDTLYLLPNTLYAVEEIATAYGHSPYADGPYDPTQVSGSADAYVDPTFAVQGQYASLYHFEGLPDGALAAAVPEPSTWAMTLLGFIGLGFARYSRLKSASVSA